MIYFWFVFALYLALNAVKNIYLAYVSDKSIDVDVSDTFTYLADAAINLVIAVTIMAILMYKPLHCHISYNVMAIV